MEKLFLFASGQQKPAEYMGTDTDNFQFLDRSYDLWLVKGFFDNIIPISFT